MGSSEGDGDPLVEGVSACDGENGLKALADRDCEDVDDKDALVVCDLLGVRLWLELSDCDVDDVDVRLVVVDWLSDGTCVDESLNDCEADSDCDGVDDDVTLGDHDMLGDMLCVCVQVQTSGDTSDGPGVDVTWIAGNHGEAHND